MSCGTNVACLSKPTALGPKMDASRSLLALPGRRGSARAQAPHWLVQFESSASLARPFFRANICAEHCLENLRKSIMCRGDRSVSTYEWMGAFPRPTTEQPHKCINWDKFDAWNAERRFDLFDLDKLEGRPAISPVSIYIYILGPAWLCRYWGKR